jgi:hypothetical protein
MRTFPWSRPSIWRGIDRRDGKLNRPWRNSLSTARVLKGSAAVAAAISGYALGDSVRHNSSPTIPGVRRLAIY